MAQMNGMEKRNFTNSARNGGKTAEMRNNSAKKAEWLACLQRITQNCSRTMHHQCKPATYKQQMRCNSQPCTPQSTPVRTFNTGIIQACVVPRTYSSFGDRASAAAGPVLWNSLPSHLKEADLLYSQFRWSLKTFLFGQWGHGTV